MRATVEIAGWRFHLWLGRPHAQPATVEEPPPNGDPGSITGTEHEADWRGDPRSFGFSPPDAY